MFQNGYILKMYQIGTEGDDKNATYSLQLAQK